MNKQDNKSLIMINPRINTLGTLVDPTLSRDLVTVVDLCISVMATSKDDIRLEGKLICHISKNK